MSVDGKRGLRKRGVLDRLGVSARTLYRLIAEGLFPRPVHVRSCSVWFEADVEAYIGRIKREGRR